ncbi:MAG: transcriptional regulator PpsR [Pseudomonadota bacterium]
MIPFKSNQGALQELSHDSIAELLGASHDITLLLNSAGVIIDVAYGGDRPLNWLADEWIGKPWVDTVTPESQLKIERLLAASGTVNGDRRWRQVNHPADQRLDVPVLYLAIKAGDGDMILALGKDLRPISDMQQQLLDMQHSIESEYVRLQQAETRYRVLFQNTGEAILIMDPQTGRVLEANPAAATLLNEKVSRIVGRNLHASFAAQSHEEIDNLVATVRATGKEGRLQAKSVAEDRDIWISAVQLQRENARLLMLRLISDDKARSGRLHHDQDNLLLDLLEKSSDGVVVTDHAGQIVSTNKAFLDMCQVASDFQLMQQPLDQWVGRPGVDVNVLRKNLQQRGSVRQFFTIINVEYGSPIDVELSAVVLDGDKQPRYGYVLRRVMRQHDSASIINENESLPASVEKMTELVGRVPLKELIRETTDIIEKMCIEAALKLTSDNRASAAEILGLSRQSLYVKLRRHGLNNDERGEDTD